jgi:hypothetical protein
MEFLMRRRHAIFIVTGLVLCLSFVVLAATRPFTDEDTSGPARLIPRQSAVKSAHVTIGPDAEIDRVVVKLVDGSRGRLTGGEIYSLGGRNMDEINRIIAGNSSERVKRLAMKSPDQVEKEKFLLERKTGHQLADMNDYFAIPVSSAAEAQNLVNGLNRLPEVEIAYPEPRPALAVDLPPPTPNYDSIQYYLRPAPYGVDADYGQTIPGGDGTGVKIVDIEGNWQFDHEDLETAVGGLLGGELINILDWRNHGTAVIGVMIGGDNGYGITGIVPNADIGMVSIGNIGVAGAILLAADSLQPGDVMLIELHAPGPRYDFEERTDQLGYVCEEYWQANFDAIQLAWAKGIIVCEAAGNGAENLDDGIYENVFDTTFRNSHAVMIGAGAPPSGTYGVDRSRLSFSNYGDRVNLQGYGRGVVTTGYGYLFTGAGDPRQYYTGDFGGTSGATPIVAGAVAALQGIYKVRYGLPIDADRLRDALIVSGSPQQVNTGQHIGPRPDIKAADSALPSPPDLSADPLYFDTTVQLNSQLTVYAELDNHSLEYSLDYSLTALDSLVKNPIGQWIIIPSPTGVISPSGTDMIEIIFDATVIEDRTQTYKGMIRIDYGESGGPLDQQAFLPIFVNVPCADTTYTAKSSNDPDGPAFQWVDITSAGIAIPSFAWYNPYVEDHIIDDGTAGKFYLRFDFPYYDTTYGQIYIGANGAVSFTDSNVNVGGYYVPVSIPNPPFTTFVSPFWNDLNFDATDGGHGTVYYYRSPAYDSFVVEFYQAGNFNDPNDTLTTFEVILTDNGNITFQYLNVGGPGFADSAIVGIADYDCASVPYVLGGDPPERIVTDSSAVLFDYAYIVWGMSGDINGDADVNVADAVYMINWIFKGGPAPKRMGEADVNCDGKANIADAVYIINYIFKGGPKPCQYVL